ncbi:MAG: hypothetical protein IPO40_12000 [Fibrobacteres bacterium]|nr:hypothetical protein [Fibrobacterota bacterium]
MPTSLKFLILLLLGFTATHARQAEIDSANGWGYPYDSLLRDLSQWKKSPWVKIDSIGASVQNRAIWMVSITDSTDSAGAVEGRKDGKFRIVAHARTHPSEVQAQRVTNEMIRFLLDSSEAASNLRRDFLWNLVPMYNPDGVMLRKSRQNANDVDLEGNWNTASMQPESKALKAVYTRMYQGPNPPRVALNMHSDQQNGARFFFYHEAGGTSSIYTTLEQDYINRVRSHFLEGIKPYTFISSWKTAPGYQYPEGFWWSIAKEDVMALTYEDDNSYTASDFDKTGKAIVLGSAEYVLGRGVAISRSPRGAGSRILLGARGVDLRSRGAGERWELRDLQGRILSSGVLSGDLHLDWSALPGKGPRILALIGGRDPAESTMLPMVR